MTEDPTLAAIETAYLDFPEEARPTRLWVSPDTFLHLRGLSPTPDQLSFGQQIAVHHRYPLEIVVNPDLNRTPRMVKFDRPDRSMQVWVDLETGEWTDSRPRQVCPSSPSTDSVGQACSMCGHTGHWPGPCRECMLDIRIAEVDRLIERMKAALAAAGE